MTILQLILAICAFAAAFWVITHYIVPGLFRNILLGLVVILALIVLLSQFGLLNLLNMPIGSPRAPLRT